MLEFNNKGKKALCQMCGSEYPHLIMLGYIYKDKLVDLICEKCREEYKDKLSILVSCSCDRKIGENNCNHGRDRYDRVKDISNTIIQAINNLEDKL